MTKETVRVRVAATSRTITRDDAGRQVITYMGGIKFDPTNISTEILADQLDFYNSEYGARYTNMHFEQVEENGEAAFYLYGDREETDAEYNIRMENSNVRPSSRRQRAPKAEAVSSSPSDLMQSKANPNLDIKFYDSVNIRKQRRSPLPEAPTETSEQIEEAKQDLAARVKEHSEAQAAKNPLRTRNRKPKAEEPIAEVPANQELNLTV